MKWIEGNGRGRPGFPEGSPGDDLFSRLRASLGGFGFGCRDFLDYLDSLGSGRWKERAEDLYLCLGLLRASSEAFKFAEREYSLRLFQAASRAGFSGEEARDVLQETWAELWKAGKEGGTSFLAGYKGRGSLFGFLRTVFLRRLWRRRAARALLARLEEEDRFPGGTPDPSGLAEGKELAALFRDLVGGALAALEEKEAALLRARHLEGEPLTRAAVRLGFFPPGVPHLRTLASRLHAKALAAFRRALLERAHKVYGMHGDDLRRLLGKSPLPLEKKRHQERGGKASPPLEGGEESYGV